MPTIDSSGCPLHVEVEGPENAPALMLSNSLGADLSMWDAQMAAFTQSYRVVRYDRRGHGLSGITPAPYSMEMLGRDALAIIDGLGFQSVNWCGLSMGGMVGQWLGANAPERIDKLVLANTSAHYPMKEPWNDRIKTVRDAGVAAIAAKVLTLWFTEDFRLHEPDTVAALRVRMVTVPTEGYVGNCAAVRDMDFRETVRAIAAPTLVIAGRQDMATTPESGKLIADRIPHATMTMLDAAHISNIEQPRAFSDAVMGFLKAI